MSTDLEAERTRVEDEIDFLGQVLDADPTPQNWARYYELTDRSIELTEEIERTPKAEAALVTDGPKDFEELKTQTRAMREHADDLRAEYLDAVAASKTFAPSDQGTRARVARRKASESEQAAMVASAEASAFWARHDERLSVAKLADDVIVRHTRERWAREWDEAILKIRHSEREAKRRGESSWVFTKGIEEAEEAKRQGPSAEFAARVRSEEIAEKAAQAVGFDPEQAAAVTAKRNAPPKDMGSKNQSLLASG